MAVNKLLPFANGVGSNVVDYATWSALSQILGQGFVTGVARSDYANRLFSQGALASYILGQFVVDETSQDADLNESVFYTNFKNALTAYIKQNAVSLDTVQTVGGVKTFTSSPLVPTADSGDNTQKTASTAFVKTAIDNSVNSVKAVSYGAQTLTDAEKSQARSNIGATTATDVQSAISNNAVKYTAAQTLTDAQKKQGCANIGAFFVPNSAEAHNCLIRGENLIGANHFEDYDELSSAIQADDWSDVFIGDYLRFTLTISGVDYTQDWLAAGFQYFQYVGDTKPAKKHIVFVPRTIISTAPMNATDTTAGGFLGSVMWGTTLPLYTAALQSVLGSSHVLKHRRALTNNMNSSLVPMGSPDKNGAVPSGNYAWTDTYACLMNPVMLTGSPASCSSLVDVMDSQGQLPLFSLAPEKAFVGETYWTSAVGSSYAFALVGWDGTINAGIGASAPRGVRPYFLFA